MTSTHFPPSPGRGPRRTSAAVALEIVRAAYVALEADDVAVLLELSSPEIEISTAEQFPWGGHHVGHQGLRAFLSTVTSELDARLHTDELFGAGDAVVHVGRTVGRSRRTGHRFDAAEVHVWTVEQGRIASLAVYSDIAALLAAVNQ